MILGKNEISGKEATEEDYQKLLADADKEFLIRMIYSLDTQLDKASKTIDAAILQKIWTSRAAFANSILKP